MISVEEFKPWRGIRPWRRHSLVLVVAGTVYMFIGRSYITEPLTDERAASLEFALNWFGLDIPITFWGWVFVMSGVLAIISSRWPPVSETWGYTVLSGLSGLWAAFYGFGYYIGDGANTSGMFLWGLIGWMWWAISGLRNPEPKIRIRRTENGHR